MKQLTIKQTDEEHLPYVAATREQPEEPEINRYSYELVLNLRDEIQDGELSIDEIVHDNHTITLQISVHT